MSVKDEESLDKQGIVRNTSHAPVSPGPLALTLDLTTPLTVQSFLAPTGALGVKMSVCVSVCLCDIMHSSFLKAFLRP